MRWLAPQPRLFLLTVNWASVEKRNQSINILNLLPIMGDGEGRNFY